MISFVIPAHNEERLIGRAITSIRECAGKVVQEYEIVVVNDASTDQTARIAADCGARVIDVKLRQIAAVRNAGARVARGSILIFIDADTVLPLEALVAAMAAFQNGAIGGGASVAWDEPCPIWGRMLLRTWNEISRLLRWAAGCFVFVRREVFEAVGGFDEHYFAGEEIILSSALKRKGRFLILRTPVLTSARKVHLYGKLEMMWMMTRLSIMGPRAWQQREGLDMWYARRESGRSDAQGACPPSETGAS